MTQGFKLAIDFSLYWRNTSTEGGNKTESEAESCQHWKVWR